MRMFSNRARISTGVGVVALLYVIGTAAGADVREHNPEAAGQPEVQQLEEIQRQLIEVQERTLDTNPELVKQIEELESMTTEAMKEAGYNPGKNIKTLESAEIALQNEQLSEEERRQVLEEALQAQQELHQAERAALEDEKVAQAHNKLQEDMMAAMRREEPDVDRLIERFQQLQMELRGGMQQQAPPAP